MPRPIRILHVDDEPGLADMVSDFLKRHNDGFTVHTAASSEEGLATLATNEIDCIVSDYEMPGQTGLDFLEEIRDTYPDLPFILYTGKGSEAIASRAMSNGVTDYLQKESCTDHYEVLANAIENAVSQFRAERRAAAMERRYQALFQQSELAIAWIEFERKTPIIRDVNPAFRTMFCAVDEEVVGDDLDTVVAAEDQLAEARALSHEIRTGQSTRQTFTRETVDGTEKVEVQVIPVPEPDGGEITYAFAIYTARDRPRLEQ